MKPRIKWAKRPKSKRPTKTVGREYHDAIVADLTTAAKAWEQKHNAVVVFCEQQRVTISNLRDTRVNSMVENIKFRMGDILDLMELKLEKENAILKREVDDPEGAE